MFMPAHKKPASSTTPWQAGCVGVVSSVGVGGVFVEGRGLGGAVRGGPSCPHPLHCLHNYQASSISIHIHHTAPAPRPGSSSGNVVLRSPLLWWHGGLVDMAFELAPCLKEPSREPARCRKSPPPDCSCLNAEDAGEMLDAGVVFERVLAEPEFVRLPKLGWAPLALLALPAWELSILDTGVYMADMLVELVGRLGSTDGSLMLLLLLLKLL